MVNAAQPNACSIPSIKSFGLDSGQTGSIKFITASDALWQVSVVNPARVFQDGI